MQKIIIDKLKEIEQKENVKVLLAVESGSRAWGFASPDSDYDVRFIYVRDKNFYFKLEKTRDVIELPINDELDINGWDIKKALGLLHSSNPTFFEWLSSPIVYCNTGFFDKYSNVINEYFSSKKSLHHYLHMAENNYRAFLRDDSVKLKKYFYVLRPELACKWILNKNTPPPMLFDELVKAELPKNLQDDVKKLLELKIHSPEVKKIQRIDTLNTYIKSTMLEIEEKICSLPSEKEKNWDSLNKMFLAALNE